MRHWKRVMLTFAVFALLPLIAAAGIRQQSTPDIYHMPPLDAPAPTTSYDDPVFGTTITRITGASENGGFGTHIYSQLQAFSPDGAYILLIEDGVFTVRSLDDFRSMSLDTTLWNAPRWLPTQPHTILHYDGNDDTMVRLIATDVTTAESETLYTFPAQYTHVRVSPSHEALARDGHRTAGMLTRDDGASVLYTLDLVTGELGAEVTIADLFTGDCQPDPEWGPFEPDWVGISPTGNYLVVQWPRDGMERCSGLETFDAITGEFVGRAYDGHQHGDLGLTPDGDEFFMTFEMSSPEDNNRPAIAIRMLPGNETSSPPQHLLTVDWADNGHISCRGPAGLCLVSYGGFDDGAWTPFEQELFLLYTDGRTRRLAHHRSTGCGYWVQPRASLSADGQRAVFASDFGAGVPDFACAGMGQGDAYVIDIPPDTPAQ